MKLNFFHSGLQNQDISLFNIFKPFSLSTTVWMMQYHIGLHNVLDNISNHGMTIKQTVWKLTDSLEWKSGVKPWKLYF